jgi:hypothetical protein
MDRILNDDVICSSRILPIRSWSRSRLRLDMRKLAVIMLSASARFLSTDVGVYRM